MIKLKIIILSLYIRAVVLADSCFYTRTQSANQNCSLSSKESPTAKIGSLIQDIHFPLFGGKLSLLLNQFPMSSQDSEYKILIRFSVIHPLYNKSHNQEPRSTLTQQKTYPSLCTCNSQ